MTASVPQPADYSGQYALSGPARVRDARITPIRGDLADIALAGKLFAPHYVVPMERAVMKIGRASCRERVCYPV